MDIKLRKIEISDKKYFAKWWRDKDLLKLTSGITKRITNKEVNEYFFKMLSGNNDFHYIILVGRKSIGHISLVKRKNGWYETQIIIGEKDYQNKGYGAKAIKLSINKARLMGIKKIYLEVRPDNIRAIRAYEKNGFKKIGIKKYPKNKYLPQTLKMVLTRTTEINKEKLVRIFISKIKVPKSNPEKQIIIAPVGVVASGKTTAMKILKSMIPAVYINADEARVFLRNKKMWGKVEAWDIITPTIRHFLKTGKSIIIDGDFVDKKTRRRPLESLAKKFNARVYYIHIIAPEEFILRKLKNKKWTKNGLFSDSKEGIKEYFRRKPLHQKKLRIRFISTVDTSKPIKSQLLKILPKIK